MKKLDVCLSTDDNYAKYAATVIYSILSNKSFDVEFVFHILYSELSEENIAKLNSINGVMLHRIDNSLFLPYFNNGVCKNVTVPTLYRLILPSLLENVDKILYLDCDLIVLKSLEKLFDIKLEENEYAACVPDLAYGEHMKRMNFEFNDKNFYFNAGVCLLDLAKMRTDGIEKKMFDYLMSNWDKLSYCDQDVMNAVLLGCVHQLDREYNFITPNFYFSCSALPTIVHFAGVKPWKIGFYNPFRKLFWKYYSFTPYANDKSEFLNKCVINLFNNKIFQILWFLKMYQFFFRKKERIHDFMRIIKNLEFNH